MTCWSRCKHNLILFFWVSILKRNRRNGGLSSMTPIYAGSVRQSYKLPFFKYINSSKKFGFVLRKMGKILKKELNCVELYIHPPICKPPLSSTCIYQWTLVSYCRTLGKEIGW